MGDGSQRFIQAKLSLDPSSDSWDRLWQQFWKQVDRRTTGIDDRLVLIFGDACRTADDLAECCSRAQVVVDEQEYHGRMSSSQRSLFDRIEAALSVMGVGRPDIRKMLSRLDIEVYPHRFIERDQAPLWMPQSDLEPNAMLSCLRDFAGRDAAVRGLFEPARLMERLKREKGIEIPEPAGWGAAAYKRVLTGRCLVEVPGTNVSRPIDENFIWPRAHRYDRSRRADFDDEAPNPWFGVTSDNVDISLFPSTGLDRVIVVSGPGFGKSTLSLALAKSVLDRGLLPAVVSVPELSKLDTDVGSFLNDRLNSEFDVSIDWSVAADSGVAVVLFDGLDEISSDRRAAALKAIKTFSLRYPGVPWLLTVRDAAALSAPTDALLVQLEAVHPDDVGRYVSFYRPDEPELSGSLRRAIEIRPDLERLVRIPLFLAILLCSDIDWDKAPSKRADLLEVYLELLFRPEQFKPSENDGVDPAKLRRVAELVAYESLEREEIGVDARRLEASVTRVLGAGASSRPEIERLTKCGVLRPSGPARFVFPFPVVQEYLAACHILDCRMGDVAARLASALKRPWAQTLQFVLEQHPDPAPLVEALLMQDDDAFGSGVRLVARCISNGMSAKPELRADVARRLCLLWPAAAWRLRGRIGSTIAESFSDPIIPELRACLCDRRLLHHGAGAAVARRRDPDLTRDVLRSLLSGNVDHLLNLGDLQNAVSALGDEAIDMYIDVVRTPGATETQCEAMACLLGHMDGRRVSEARLMSVALDESLPLVVRLEAFAIGPQPVDGRVVPLVDAALANPGYHFRSAAVKVIFRYEDPVQGLRAALLRPDLDLKEKLEVINYLPRHISLRHKADCCRSLSNDTAIDEAVRRRLSIFAARYGDRDAMGILIRSADHLPFEELQATISIFGHHPSLSLAQEAADLIRRRALSPRNRASLAGSVVLGMTALFEMNMFEGGGIEPCAPHPGLEIFRTLVEEWGELRDYDPESGLELAENLVRLGSSRAALQRTEQCRQVISSNEINLQDSIMGSNIGEVLRTLSDRHHPLPLSFLESIIDRCSYNGASAAVQMIASSGTRESLETLLDLHRNRARFDLKDAIMNCLETLASRLGVRISENRGRLEVGSLGD
jgi:hypothetical protein